MNELIFFIAIIFFLIAVILMFKGFGKSGLFVFIAFATILANIQACKQITLFGLTTTAGNVLYASSFLCTDILSERYGKKDAKQAVYLGICVNVLWVIGTFITIKFLPISEDFQKGLETVLGLQYRVCLGSLLGYVSSQTIDVSLYHFLWKKCGNKDKGLWIRNNFSTLTSQLVDTVVFTLVAFLGVLPINAVISILLTTYLFKAIVALFDTPFMYIAKKVNPLSNDTRKEEN